jgi:type IV pilus assembly protein PilC
MAQFTVEAVDAQGKRIKAEVAAGSANEAIAKAKGRGLKVSKVVPKEEPKAAGGDGEAAAAPGAAVGAAAPAAAKKKSAGKTGSVGSKLLTQFTTQLSVLMNAGLPIVRSLKILAQQMKPGTLKNIATEVADDVETGSSLSEAMAKHPRCFDKLYTNMVRAGEAGGVLDVILERLSQYMEKSEALKRKVVGAMIYPIVVITIAVTVVLVIMTFIVPQFQKVFMDLKIELPGPTQLLLAMSDFIKGFWWAIILAPIVSIFGLKSWGKTKTGRFYMDKVKLMLPVAGTIFRKGMIARFCRTLGTLLQSGVPILEALNIVRGTVGNEIAAVAIGKVHDSVKEGESIAGPLGESGVFDDIVVNMIDVGEETGELDKMLMKIADNYDVEVDAAVGNLVHVMEPALIVGLGITVGFIVVSLFMPLISLLQGIGGDHG